MEATALKVLVHELGNDLRADILDGREKACFASHKGRERAARILLVSGAMPGVMDRPAGCQADRTTQGVRIIKLEDKDRACSIAQVRES